MTAANDRSPRPFILFALLAFALSWSAWGVAFAARGTAIQPVAHYLGGFGPMLSAMVLIRLQGQSVTAWLKGLFRWRVGLGWYAFALGFPVLLALAATAGFAVSGGPVSAAVLPERLAGLVPVFLMMALIGGGNEEPGWRGFGLPALQARFGPLGATLILGLVWALWHLPLAAMGPDAPETLAAIYLRPETAVLLVSITCHAFWYTWLLNRTGSVLLCILLHAGYNTANSVFVLVPDDIVHGAGGQQLLLIMTGLVVASALGLTLATRGDLGRSRPPTA